MKAEQYRENGFRYEDYLKLGQWQRLRDFLFQVRQRRGVNCVTLVVIFWPLRCWNWPRIDQSQEFSHFCLGPFDIQICV